MKQDGISIHEIAHGGTLWKEVLTHRDRILRQPLGLSLSSDDVIDEDTHRHFILRRNNDIVAGLIGCPPKDGTIKIRQMWVHEDHEATGLGRRLLQEVSEILAREGIRTLTLHARETARGFYEKCGYHVIGDLFTEIGISHIGMARELAPPTQADKTTQATKRHPHH